MSSAPDSDDKVGITAELKYNVTVSPKVGAPVTLTTSPVEDNENEIMVSISLAGAAYGYAMLYCESTDEHGSTGRGGRSISADETGTFQASYSVEDFEAEFTPEGVKIELMIYSDTTVTGDTTGAYTVTTHPVTVQG